MHVKRPFQATHWRGTLILLAAFLLTATACAPRTTTPTPAVAAGAVDGTGYRFLRWNEGLAIMIWYDFRGESGSSSTSSGGGLGAPPTYTVHGYAESEEGERFQWEVETTDGRTARLRLDGEPYDLSGGTLFVVKMEDGRADVTQLDRDLSVVESNHVSIVAFARDDPDLAPLIGDELSPSGESPPPTPGSPVMTPLPDASTYRNEEHGFALRYPPDVEPGLTCPTEAIIDEPLVTFRLTATEYYSGTNLLDACATIRVDRSEEARESCTRPRDDHEDLVGQEEINRIPFTIFSVGGVATGHIYDVTSYCTVHADTCYEITLFVHYANIGVYEPGTVAEFGEETVKSKLAAVLHTFHFLL
jgi:hypothetical protein